jgi:hypothetical protein
MSQAKTVRINPANAWCFTLNNYTEEEHGALVQRFRDLRDQNEDPEKMPFDFIIGKEVGEQGTPHLQGYIKMKDPKRRFRPVPKFAIFRDGKQAIHWEKAKCGIKQNYNYCSKEGDFITNMAAPYMTYNEAKEIVSRDIHERTLEEFDRAALHVAMFEEYDVCTDMQRALLRSAYDKMCKIYYAIPEW